MQPTRAVRPYGAGRSGVEKVSDSDTLLPARSKSQTIRGIRPLSIRRVRQSIRRYMPR